jgi:hypothetical protein
LIGTAVFTVKRLIETGMKTPAAHKAVAGNLKALNVKPARGRALRVTARTVREWCGQVAADVGRRGEAAQTYDGLICDARGDVTALNPPEARKLLLGRLTEVAKKIRADEST